jgi:hypothetical protein
MTEIESALDAMTIARVAADKANLPFYMIHDVRREGYYWIVRIATSNLIYVVKIDARTGGVVEFGSQ